MILLLEVLLVLLLLFLLLLLTLSQWTALRADYVRSVHLTAHQ